MSKRIAGEQRDKLIVALLMDDIVRDINTAMAARKATITLDFSYKDHLARAYVSMPGVDRMGWMIANPRTRICQRVIPYDPDLAALVNDIHYRLDKHQSRIVLLAEKPPGKKRRCKLQIQVGGSASIVLMLVEADEGQVKHDTSYQTPDGRTP